MHECGSEALIVANVLWVNRVGVKVICVSRIFLWDAEVSLVKLPESSIDISCVGVYFQVYIAMIQVFHLLLRVVKCSVCDCGWFALHPIDAETTKSFDMPVLYFTVEKVLLDMAANIYIINY